jgi:hypothetical protein
MNVLMHTLRACMHGNAVDGTAEEGNGGWEHHREV